MFGLLLEFGFGRFAVHELLVGSFRSSDVQSATVDFVKHLL